MKAQFWRQTRVVFGKEIKCFASSKNGLITTLIFAIVICPVYLWFGSFIMDSMAGGDTVYKIGVYSASATSFESSASSSNISDESSTDNSNEVSAVAVAITLLSQVEELEVQTVELADFENRDNLLADGTLDVVLSIENTDTTAYFSSEHTNSTMALSILQSLLLSSTGFSAEDISEIGGVILISYMYVTIGLMMLCVSTASAMAISATVKEKESGTFEAFLSTGIHPFAASLGKWLATFISTLLLTVVCAVSTIIALFIGIGDSKSAATWELGVTLLVVAVSSSLLFSGLMIAVTSAASTQKEAQIYNTIFMLLAFVPIFFLYSARVGSSADYWYIPSLNSSAFIRDGFYGFYDFVALGLSIIPGVIIAILGVLVASQFMRVGRASRGARSRQESKKKLKANKATQGA